MREALNEFTPYLMLTVWVLMIIAGAIYHIKKQIDKAKAAKK
jgi:hypothetical protein